MINQEIFSLLNFRFETFFLSIFVGILSWLYIALAYERCDWSEEINWDTRQLKKRNPDAYLPPKLKSRVLETWKKSPQVPCNFSSRPVCTKDISATKIAREQRYGTEEMSPKKIWSSLHLGSWCRCLWRREPIGSLPSGGFWACSFFWILSKGIREAEWSNHHAERGCGVPNSVLS